jgi:hypothetical protein
MKIIASEQAMRRWLGGAFLAVFVLSVVTQLPQLVAASDGAKSLLVAVADSASLLRLVAVAELLNSLAIGVLAALLYVVLSRRHRTLALVALGWWWAEAIVLATSKIASLVLIDLSVDIAAASASMPASYQIAAEVLHSIDSVGYQIHVLFFGAGALLWYSLLYASAYVPRVLSGWGLAAVSLVVINTFLVLAGHSIESLSVLSVTYLLFEPVIGVWLLVRGVPPGPSAEPITTTVATSGAGYA